MSGSKNAPSSISRAGHDAGLDDPPLAVGVAQERVERAHPLGEPAVEPIPLARR